MFPVATGVLAGNIQKTGKPGVNNMFYSNLRINTYFSMAILVVGMGAVSVLAADRNVEYVDTCRAELNQHYGQEMAISLVSKRRNPAGVEVKLAARLDDNNVEFLNCWVPNNDEAHSSFDQGANAVAITVQPVPVVQ